MDSRAEGEKDRIMLLLRKRVLESHWPSSMEWGTVYLQPLRVASEWGRKHVVELIQVGHACEDEQ